MMIIENSLAEPVPMATDSDYERRQELMDRLCTTGIHSSAPIILGSLVNQVAFSELVPDLRSVPGSVAAEPDHGYFLLDFGHNDIRSRLYCQLPPQLGQFEEAVALIARYEHQKFPQARYEGPAHLTIDQSTVEPGEQQRESTVGHPIHRDGLSLWLHNYVVADYRPTEFFETDKPILGRSVDEGILRAIGARQGGGREYDVVFSNSTALHRSPIISDRVVRTFLRLTFTHAEIPLHPPEASGIL